MTELEYNDIRAFYSSASHAGINYLGGARATEEISDNYLYNLFSKITPDEQATGIIKYRCFYFYNNSATDYIKNPTVFVVSDTTSPNDSVAVGWGTSEIGNGIFGSTDFSIEQSVANENTAPLGVQFFSGNTRSAGAILNADIPPKKGKAVWIQYTSLFNAQDFPFNIFRLRLVADNLITTATRDIDPNLPPQIMFDVFGNCSSDSDFTTLASRMLPANPHFLITTGNNNTDSNPQFFISTMGPSFAKTMLALGPKDVINATVMNAYLNEMAKYQFITNPQRTYYSRNFGNIHVLVMNTSGNIPYTNPSEQYDFVVEDLRAANTNPKIDWIFVVTSRPIYGTTVIGQVVVGGQDTTIVRPYYPDLATTYHKIFADNGVLCVFQGQINWMERLSVLKYNASDVDSPQGLAYDGPDNYTINGRKNFVDGCIFYTVGAGGDVHDAGNQVIGQNNVLNFNTIDFGFVKVLVENRLDHPKITFRMYATSRNMIFFSSQFTVTRMS